MSHLSKLESGAQLIWWHHESFDWLCLTIYVVTVLLEGSNIGLFDNAPAVTSISKVTLMKVQICFYNFDIVDYIADNTRWPADGTHRQFMTSHAPASVTEAWVFLLSLYVLVGLLAE